MAKSTPQRERYDFYLNPYDDIAFTKCPRCERPTKQRKLPLVIACRNPDGVLFLNKTCRFCPSCELLIARKREIEPMVAASFKSNRPLVEGEDWMILGTADRADWREGAKTQTPKAEILDRVWFFRKHLEFEIRGGWGPAEQ